MANERKWTVMVYMAGDNDLSNRCVDDLRKMKLVGSKEGVVDLLVQVDRSGEVPTKRYHIKSSDANGPLSNDEEQLEEALDEDTGNADTLRDFIFWCIDNFEAQHYLLVLWGHARGLDVIPTSTRSGRRHRYYCSVNSRYPRRETPVRRSPFFIICPDEKTRDALTNFELQEVLSSVKDKIKRKIDVFGMDACLMSIAEMCYEVRDSVNFTVGSETLVPSVGWPYHRIMRELVDDPTMSPQQLSGLIVKKFVEFYKDYDAENVQLSACDLTGHESLVRVINNLAQLLIEHIQAPTINNAVLKAHWRAQSYDEDQYFDLYDFCSLLRQDCTRKDIKRACAEVMMLIDPKSFALEKIGDESDAVETDAAESRSFVIESAYLGDSLQFSYGLSIYFPWADVSERYQHLDFARDTAWLDFLNVYVENTKREPRMLETS